MIQEEPTWLLVGDVLTLHAISLTIHGGISGVRDQGALESALDRPVNKWHYGQAGTIAELAAAYMFGIARNHPFSDGNKRAALSVAVAFLRLNGYKLIPPSVDESVEFVVAVAAGQYSESEIAQWITRYTANDIEAT